MLDVVSILSRLLTEPTDPFQAIKTAKVEKPEPPTPPTLPSATFNNATENNVFPAYTARGKLLQLGQFATSAIRENAPESTGGKPDVALQHAAVIRIADHYGAQLLAQLFPFFKESLWPDKRERREQQNTLEFSAEAEEQALELLNQILELAEDSDDIIAFVAWLDERIQIMEWELVTRLGNLPEKAEKVFRILRQASEALQHGVTPAHIRQTLANEIQRKKELNE